MRHLLCRKPRNSFFAERLLEGEQYVLYRMMCSMNIELQR
jgi:hypothetical protein